MSRRTQQRASRAARERALDARARTDRPKGAEPSRFTDDERAASEAAFADLLARQRTPRQEHAR